MKNLLERHDFKWLKPLRRRDLANLVIRFRKGAGWKQLALAYEAGVNERTIQRLERGERVEEQTLRRVAVAFGLAEEAFLGSHRLLDIRPLSGHADCHRILSAERCQVDDSLSESAATTELALFLNALADYRSNYSLLPPREQMEVTRNLFMDCRALESKHHLVRIGSAESSSASHRLVTLVLIASRHPLARLSSQMIPRQPRNLL